MEVDHLINIPMESRKGRLHIRSASVLSLVMAVVGIAAAVHADTIPTIYGTGVGTDGLVLQDGELDPHYQITVSPDPEYPGPEAYALDADSPAILGDYVANTAASRWIGPRADAGPNVPGGYCEQQTPNIDCFHADYHFQTTFDLTGLDHTSAVISGRWAMDDSGEMFLNGQPIGVRRPYVYGPMADFRTWADFTISHGFVPGLNTLVIVVNNRYFPLNPDDNGLGLHIEILSATADPDTCPEDPAKGNPGQCGCGNPDTDTDQDGTADCVDQCPDDPRKATPGACGCGIPDIDTDNDGVLNCIDDCPFDPAKIAPGICGCDASDAEAPSCPDNCPDDPNATAPGMCGCGQPSQDEDSDGTVDCLDGCPGDYTKTSPGLCGCGVAETDSDADGTVDCLDQCPSDPAKSVPGVCGCGATDQDYDGDGTSDCTDLCPRQAWKIEPGVCTCTTPDTDSDGDATPNCIDGCPDDPNKIAPGLRGCGVADPPSISTLFSTGVGANHLVLGDSAVDPHYVMTISPDPLYPGPAVYTMNGTSPPILGGYVDNSVTSRWIGPRGDGGHNLPNGNCPSEYPEVDCAHADYYYQTTFDLTGLDHTQAVINGQWACDDSGEIILNGVSTGIARPKASGPQAAYQSLVDFTITSGFVPGVNTLVFKVNNFFNENFFGANSTGLRVAILSAYAELDTCPEDPIKGSPGACGCGTPDTDTDGDTVPDCIDNCPAYPNVGQEDIDNNQIGDACEGLPVITSAVSVKTHGASGDWALDVLQPPAGKSLVVEPRVNGPTLLQVTFDRPIIGLGELDVSDVSVSSGSVNGVSLLGQTLTVQLAGMSNGSAVTVGFPGIQGLSGSAVEDTLCIGALIGDSNGDSVTNIVDLVSVRNSLGAAITLDDFLVDVNLDGIINILDLVWVRNDLNVFCPTSCP